MESLLESARTGRAVEVTSRAERPRAVVLEDLADRAREGSLSA